MESERGGKSESHPMFLFKLLATDAEQSSKLVSFYFVETGEVLARITILHAQIDLDSSSSQTKIVSS